MLETYETVARAVADPSRARILKLLEDGELCVCQITAVLDLAPATVSKHLAHLKTAGLLQQRRDGKWIYYRLAEHDFNEYSRAFLLLLRAALTVDPVIVQDRAMLSRIQAVPVSLICEQGRRALASVPSPAPSLCCGVS